MRLLKQIRDNAEFAVRNLLRDVAKTRGTKLHAKDHLDDGSPIELHVDINEEDGSAIFDFEGTGLEMIGNLNTPISVTYSAVIYCLRAMVDLDVSHFRLKVKRTLPSKRLMITCLYATDTSQPWLLDTYRCQNTSW